MRYLVITAAAGLALSACATVPADGDPPIREFADTCEAEPGQRFLGQRASVETGTAIMRATDSVRLRWVPPNTAVTMEYAYGRVTVGYDANYTITSIGCS